MPCVVSLPNRDDTDDASDDTEDDVDNSVTDRGRGE